MAFFLFLPPFLAVFAHRVLFLHFFGVFLALSWWYVVETPFLAPRKHYFFLGIICLSNITEQGVFFSPFLPLLSLWVGDFSCLIMFFLLFVWIWDVQRGMWDVE